jgi:hypothetical protein
MIGAPSYITRARVQPAHVLYEVTHQDVLKNMPDAAEVWRFVHKGTVDTGQKRRGPRLRTLRMRDAISGSTLNREDAAIHDPLLSRAVL